MRARYDWERSPREAEPEGVPSNLQMVEVTVTINCYSQGIRSVPCVIEKRLHDNDLEESASCSDLHM